MQNGNHSAVLRCALTWVSPPVVPAMVRSWVKIPLARFTATGSFARVGNATSADLIWENIITWNKKFGDHSIDITGVTSYISSQIDSSYAQGTGQIIPGQNWKALVNNPLNLGVWSNYIGSNLLSGAFRLNYGYKGKYLLTLTGRADGSSVLLKENRWSFFPLRQWPGASSMKTLCRSRVCSAT